MYQIVSLGSGAGIVNYAGGTSRRAHDDAEIIQETKTKAPVPTIKNGCRQTMLNNTFKNQDKE